MSALLCLVDCDAQMIANSTVVIYIVFVVFLCLATSSFMNTFILSGDSQEDKRMKM